MCVFFRVLFHDYPIFVFFYPFEIDFPAPHCCCKHLVLKNVSQETKIRGWYKRTQSGCKDWSDYIQMHGPLALVYNCITIEHWRKICLIVGEEISYSSLQLEIGVIDQPCQSCCRMHGDLCRSLPSFQQAHSVERWQQPALLVRQIGRWTWYKALVDNTIAGEEH
jgi:hypothetical protein